MLHDNKCVVTCLYFNIHTYTDAYVHCVSFCFNVNVYIIVATFIRTMNQGLIDEFCVLSLMYCFYALSQMNKLYM